MSETPILSALVEMARKDRIPLHVPGHKQGRSLPPAFGQWLGSAPLLDLTELPGLDNLHAPTGCIRESEQLCASHYGSDRCFYSVNGSTAGVMAALLACARAGTVLFLNPFHKSAWQGLVLADAEPRFAPFAWDPATGTIVAPDPATVQRTIAATKDIRAVYVTSPTYMGAVAPVRAYAEICHAHGIPLIVDEAHGAHLGLCPELPEHSVAAGADVVIHSAHKMLPALTQTAWVHVQGPYVRADDVEQALSLLQSTSPSYLLLASLDAAQAWLRTSGREAAASLLEALAAEGLWDAADAGRDPFRHFIPTGDAGASQRIREALEQVGAYVEYADASGVLAMFGFGLRRSHLQTYRRALSQGWRLDADRSLLPAAPNWYRLLPVLRQVLRPSQVEAAPWEWTPVAEAEGRICARPVVPYPPGVPVVLPGQHIDAEVQQLLVELSHGHPDVHGLRGGRDVAVVVDSDGDRRDTDVHHAGRAGWRGQEYTD